MRWAIGLAKEGDHSDLSAAQRTLGGRCLGASSPHVTPYGRAAGWRVFPSVIEGRLWSRSVVRGESVALHRGRTTMVWQTSITNEAGKPCAVVTQTQLVLEGKG